LNHDPEQWRKYQEAIQHASQHRPEALSPEQWQMVQTALQQMQQTGATQFTYRVTRLPDGTVVQQGDQPAGNPSGWPGEKAPPTTVLPGQQPTPSAIPQGYLDPLYQSAVAELQRWMAQYERYRTQGSFARLEPIFQMIKHITG
jgi:hypothetical protein